MIKRWWAGPLVGGQVTGGEGFLREAVLPLKLLERHREGGVSGEGRGPSDTHRFSPQTAYDLSSMRAGGWGASWLWLWLFCPPVCVGSIGEVSLP